jgi:hypothetical protein
VIESFAFIGAGILVYLSADSVGRLYSHRADKSTRDGVIRRGGLSRKVWREDDPERFAFRIDDDRFASAAIRWFLKIWGAIFAIGGIVQLIGLVAK